MRTRQSHETWILGLAGTLAIIFGVLAVGAFRGGSSHSAQALRESASRQSRVLAERTLDRIGSIRNETLAIQTLDQRQSVKKLPKDSGSLIQHWARWNSETRALESYASQERIPALQASDWNEIAREIPWQGSPESGSALLIHGKNAFFLFWSGRQSILAAGIDPAQAFPLSSRDWKSIEPGGPSVRLYLIARGGLVLSHSMKARKGADLSKSQIYIEALSDALSGGRPGGSGKYLSNDRLPVEAAYERIEPYDLVAVAEAVESKAGVLGARWKARALGTVFFLLSLASMAFSFRVLQQRRDRRSLERSDFAKVLSENASLPPIAQTFAPLPRVTSDTLVLSEVREPERVHQATPMAEHSPKTWAPKRGIDAQIVETALFQELRTPSREALEERERRVRIARLETELMELAAFPEDEQVSRLFAERLADFVAQTVGAPALYFRVHHESARAILDAVEGIDAFDQDLIQGGLAFPILPRAIGKARDAAARGSILSMTDDPALAQLMKIQFHGRPYQAWAIQGLIAPKQVSGKSRSMESVLFGILVCMIAGPRNEAEADTLSRLIRVTGRLYENGTVRSEA